MNDGSNVGAELAKELVVNLVRANQNSTVTHQIMVELRDLMVELCGNFAVLSRAMEMLHEARGKKLNMSDFAQAWCEAEEEIYRDDDEEGDDGGHGGAPDVGPQRPFRERV